LPSQAVHDEVSVLGHGGGDKAAPARQAVRGGEEVMQAAIKAASAPAPRQVVEKVGRNEACPCGSGKKYKKCCGAALA
jgi:uncharacterized protein YecA (UPF0149 family)